MEQGNVDLPILIGQSGPLNGLRWVIEREKLIGREDTCDVVIADRQVSRYHARLYLGNEGIYLEDLASKNGTYINTVKISEPVLLQDGDVIQIALLQQFVFLSSDATVPLGPNVSLKEGMLSVDQSRRLVLDKLSRRVWIEGAEVLPPLSAPQFRLLETLYENPGKVVSRQELVIAVWGDKEAVGVSEQALDALVRRLRDRLAATDARYNYLVTVRGYGLRLDNPVD
jgi:predicted component of type VI protein secretion system